jgi:predicted phosphodiesterase
MRRCASKTAIVRRCASKTAIVRRCVSKVAKCKPIALRILSDIHLESNSDKIGHALKPYVTPLASTRDHYNTLCLLGDIGDPTTQTYLQFLRAVSQTYDQVLVLAGNHEYYHDPCLRPRIMSMQEIDRRMADWCDEFPNVMCLQNKSMILQHRYHIIGSTFWSHIYDKMAARKYYNDYRHIYRKSQNSHANSANPRVVQGKMQRLAPSDTNQLHAESVAYLKTELEQHPSLPKIVLTHHSPLIPSERTPTAAPRFYNSPSEAFHSDQSDLIQRHRTITLWAFGHTHMTTDFFYGATRIMSNQMGYGDHGGHDNPDQVVVL